MSEALLTVSGLKLHFVQRYGVFKQHRSTVRAVDGVDLEILPGETLGLVGESGCGKSSLGKALLKLHQPNAGNIWYRQHNLATLSQAELRPLRAKLQMVFQDPYESLNPRHTIEHVLEEPFIVHKQGDRHARRQKIEALLDLVGLGHNALSKYPHEFSGGQRQRIGIARAIALEPELLICDEAVSSLDVSVQAQIINLLLKIQQQMGLAMLFISHDLSVVRHISDRIAVMYKGKLVEQGDAQALCDAPAHPYTRALLNSVPRLGHDWMAAEVASGEVDTQTGQSETACAFAPRCPRVQALCLKREPELIAVSRDSTPRFAACHFPEPGFSVSP
ncbi:MAG: oligopeptide/dipeptide ABC transporter ATP-binding protein [Bermanella sp.]|jgi:oligopeptide/dipeptide ABC transporter ATP-binding protein